MKNTTSVKTISILSSFALLSIGLAGCTESTENSGGGDKNHSSSASEKEGSVELEEGRVITEATLVDPKEAKELSTRLFDAAKSCMEDRGFEIEDYQVKDERDFDAYNIERTRVFGPKDKNDENYIEEYLGVNIHNKDLQEGYNNYYNGDLGKPGYDEAYYGGQEDGENKGCLTLSEEEVFGGDEKYEEYTSGVLNAEYLFSRVVNEMSKTQEYQDLKTSINNCYESKGNKGLSVVGLDDPNFSGMSDDDLTIFFECYRENAAEVERVYNKMGELEISISKEKEANEALENIQQTKDIKQEVLGK